MAESKDSGDKTEKPTPKRLRDARKKGDVVKSKDVGAAFVTLGWLMIIALCGGYIARELVSLTQLMLEKAAVTSFQAAYDDLARAAVWSLVKITAITLVPIAVFATLVEFAQVGPVSTTEKMKPSFDKMNPIEGLKRMFGKDGLVELVKTLVKVLLVCLIIWIALKSAIAESGALVSIADWSPLAGNGPLVAEFAMSTTYKLTLQIFALITLVFLFVAVLDYVYAHHSYIKKMMMSMRDIKKEHKDDEGDPYIKGARRQMHEEWANQNSIGATGGAAALLVNPTHIAIALDYDAEHSPVPTIAAKGQGPLAAAMRAEAERAGVPIIKHIATARRLWARGEVGEIVPQEMFDAIAEIILWSKQARDGKAPMWTDLDKNKTDFQIREELDA